MLHAMTWDNVALQDVNLRKWKRQQCNCKCLYTKGKLGNFLLAQNLCRSQTKRNLNRHFSPKSPKVSQKSGQIVQNLQQKKGPKGIRRTEGIHYLHIWPPNFWRNPSIILRPTECCKCLHFERRFNPACCTKDTLPAQELKFGDWTRQKTARQDLEYELYWPFKNTRAVNVLVACLMIATTIITQKRRRKILAYYNER